ncbi:MAG: hypothetical protein E6Q44_08450 [Flavobacteriales bacterium]|nr:MAG: hypothetical protein E6Q44_08450 [Flavobacteriales bacterium]
MQRSTRIVLVVLGVIVVLGLAAIGAVTWFIARNADGWVDRGRKQMEEGRAAGAMLDSRGCVDRAIADYREDTGPISAIAQRVWLTGCLETATPERAVCPTLKADTTLEGVGELLAARAAFCARHGLPGDQGCQQLAEAVEAFCFDVDTPESELLGEPQ